MVKGVMRWVSLVMTTSAVLAQGPANPVGSSPVNQPMTVASTQPGSETKITSTANIVHLSVVRPTSLSQVVSALCEQQQVKCEGTDHLASFQTVGMTVDGTLRQVISKLLEGTDVNYSFSRNEQGLISRITFFGKAPHGTIAVSPNPTTVEVGNPANDSEVTTANDAELSNAASEMTPEQKNALNEAFGPKPSDKTPEDDSAKTNTLPGSPSAGQGASTGSASTETNAGSPFPSVAPTLQPTVIPGSEFPSYTPYDATQIPNNGSPFGGPPPSNTSLKSGTPPDGSPVPGSLRPKPNTATANEH